MPTTAILIVPGQRVQLSIYAHANGFDAVRNAERIGRSHEWWNLAAAAGVVLAAGAGTRYGMPKVLAGGGRMAARRRVGACRRRLRRRRRRPGRGGRRRAGAGAGGGGGRLGRGDERVAAGGVSACKPEPPTTRCCITVDTPDVGADAVRRVLDAARTIVAVGYRPGPLRRTAGSSRRHRALLIGRSWSRRRAATRGRGRSWRPAMTSSGWTAPTSRRADDIDVTGES